MATALAAIVAYGMKIIFILTMVELLLQIGEEIMSGNAFPDKDE